MVAHKKINSIGVGYTVYGILKRVKLSIVGQCEPLIAYASSTSFHQLMQSNVRCTKNNRQSIEFEGYGLLNLFPSIMTFRNRNIFHLADYYSSQFDEISLLMQNEKSSQGILTMK